MDESDRRDPAIRGWRDAYVGLQAAGSASCPPAERLASLVLGGLPDEERDALADHVVGCRPCSRTVEELMALHVESRDELPRTERRRLAPWHFAAAAILIVAAGLPIVLWRSEGPSGLVSSSPRGGDAETGPIEPPDRATLAEAPTRFAWPAEPGADGYRVVLFDTESTPIWESPKLLEPWAAPPEVIRAGLRRGNDYTWRVTTVVGVEQRSSELHRFRLAP